MGNVQPNQNQPTQDREQYERDGYLVVRGLLSEEDVNRLRAETDKAITRRIQPILFEEKVGTDTEAIPAMYKDDEGRVFRRLNRILDRGGAFEELICGPVASAAAKIIDQPFSICLNRHNMLMIKAPRNMSPVHWHQDAPIWNEGTYDYLSIIVPLDNFLPENGGLQVVPGSHKLGPLETGARHMEVVKEQYSDLITREAVMVDLKAGDVLFFHGLLLHGSGGNRSDSLRRSITIALHPGDLREISTKKDEGAPEVRILPLPGIA